MIITRSAKIEELDTLFKFEQEIIEFERPYDDTLKTEPFHYYDLKELILSDSAEVIVATENGELVGSGYAKIVDSKHYKVHKKHAHVGFIFVEPNVRGKGINGKVLEALKRWTVSRDIFEMKLDVYADNTSAIRAYEKFGYKKDLINMRLKISKH